MSYAVQIDTLKKWLGAGSINLFGMPYAGKDTQGSTLAHSLGTQLIGGGDILRNSVIPPRAQEIIRAGGLAPTEDYLRIILPFFQRDTYVGKPLVLSSVGRWQGEESSVVQALESSGHRLKAVIYLHMEERIVWRRWQSNQLQDTRGERHDDAAEALELRLEEFWVKTTPVIEFYRSLGMLIEIDCNRAIEEVEHAIIQSLLERASA